MPKILIVDDKEENRYVLENFFNLFDIDADIELHMAESGVEAFEKAKLIKPDLVLMDVIMETDDAGLAATRKNREEPAIKDTVVWAVTASAMEGTSDEQSDREKCLSAGCNAYIAKPFDQIDLIRKIADLLQLEIPAETRALMGIED